MSDYVVIDGDLAMFNTAFGAATVVVRPGLLAGSGGATVGGKRVCIEGDETSVSVPGCTYFTPSHPQAGTGTLSIDSLAADQIASKTQSGKKLVLLVGSTFNAKLTVAAPAMQPTPTGPVPDTTLQYMGTGSFSTTNTKLKGV